VAIDAALDLYATTFNDLIVSVPLSPVLTSAQNVGSASSIGAEFSVSAVVNDVLDLAWSYTLQDVRDRTGRPELDGTKIAYTPSELIGVAATLHTSIVRSRIEWNYTSYRYAQPGAEYSSMLPSYNTFNIQVGAHAPGKFIDADIVLRCDNIFDSHYMIIRGYPMPGRTVRITVAVRS